ncbi:hypothetical protein SAMN06295912_10792 [Sphingomonas laterariae]|uniref:Lysozyme inhibitor LprI N-terminal domain-containing protein n=1 Tax=Edaphosphingomonas laterariae TaxID=861865 RepID=A0A239ET43_9SPHN|nr:hypothetical protein [Sphingomonas laterariae]SNS47759.1 hypothetical protein SAMN06295912_10792 [Sphingomonas laterariae]
MVARRWVMLALAWAGLSTVPAEAVPPPTPGDMAGCATSTFVVDAAVCADPALRAADDRLHAFLRSKGALLDRPPPFIEPQAQWFARRNACARARDQQPCLRDAYAERMALLDMMEAAPAPTRTLGCPKPLADTAQAAVGPGRVVLIDAGGQVIAVAPSASPRSSWRPFVQAELRGAEVRLRRVDGARLRCR